MGRPCAYAAEIRGHAWDIQMTVSDFGGSSYVLVPDVLLTPEGPKRGIAIAVDKGRIEAIGGADAVERNHSTWRINRLSGRAVIPGFVDAHVHLGQGFAKAATFGEPS